MRGRCVHAEAGYDGEYGRIRVWGEGECPSGNDRETRLFDDPVHEDDDPGHALELLEFDLAAFQELKKTGRTLDGEGPGIETTPGGPAGLNGEQLRAVVHTGSPSLIIAGPGTGKTRTVVEKICRLVRSGVEPRSIVAVTFANRAANELRERLEAADARTDGVRVFHLSRAWVFPY